MPTSSQVREKRVLQLVEWARLGGLNSCSPRISRRLVSQAKKLFLVTDETAADYASLALRVLEDPLRSEIEIQRMRDERAEP